MIKKQKQKKFLKLKTLAAKTLDINSIRLHYTLMILFKEWWLQSFPKMFVFW